MLADSKNGSTSATCNEGKQDSKLIELFKEYLLNSGREGSVRCYVGDVARYLNSFNIEHSYDLSMVSTQDIVEYRNNLENSGRSPSTINRSLVSLNIFFKWLMEANIVTSNPVKNVKQIKIPKALSPKWLCRQDQSILKSVVLRYGTIRDRAIIFMFLNSGLRESELINLRIRDIKKAGSITYISIIGKNNKYREVPLNRIALKFLNAWLECIPDNQDTIVFPNKYGNKLSERGLYKIVKKYASMAGLDDVHPHTLRHTFCKNLVDSGVSIERVALLAGHATIEITQIYTLPSLSDLKDSVEFLVWNNKY